MLATARNLSSFNKYKLRRHWLCNRFASMHPASDVRYFVIMSRAMFIAILNGRRGGGRDLARISRDTRLLRCIRFVILVEKNITVFFLALFFFFFLFRYVGEFSWTAAGSFWKLASSTRLVLIHPRIHW